MCGTEALGDRICELAAHLKAANCRLFELIAQFDREQGCGVDGGNSCAHWVNWKCDLSENTAREKVRVAHTPAKLPLIHAGFSKGEISHSKVCAMSRVTTPGNEDDLLMPTKHGTAAHVEALVRAYRRVKADLDEANTRHQRRELSWYFMVVVKVRLTPEDDAEECEETSLRDDRAAETFVDEALLHCPPGST